MPLAIEGVERLCRDALLLTRFGWSLQKEQADPSAGVSFSRLTHSAARLLLDWRRHLNYVTGYSRIHDFYSDCTPYRLGSVLTQAPGAREPNSDRPPLNRWFLDDLIDGGDIVFLHYGVSLQTEHIGRRTEKHVVFPDVDPMDWAGPFERFGLSILEMQLADDLAHIYGQLTSKDVIALASCSTLENTRSSVLAEIYLWHNDYTDAMKCLRQDDPDDRADTRTSTLASCLRWAYACASQVEKKVEMATEIESIRDQRLADVRGSALVPGIQEDLESQDEDEFGAELEIADAMAALTHFTSDMLAKADSGAIISEEVRNEKRGDARATLLRLGASARFLDSISAKANQPIRDHSALATDFSDLHRLVNECAEKLSFPTEFARDLWD